MDARGKSAYGGVRGRLDGEVESCGEANGAQQAELVFFKTAHWRANGAKDPRVKVGEAADMIDHCMPQ